MARTHRVQEGGQTKAWNRRHLGTWWRGHRGLAVIDKWQEEAARDPAVDCHAFKSLSANRNWVFFIFNGNVTGGNHGESN